MNLTMYLNVYKNQVSEKLGSTISKEAGRILHQQQYSAD